MIQIDKISEINTHTDEGKLLLAAIAILTSIEKEDIIKKEWGGSVHPDDAIKKVEDLANRIFFEEEWKSLLLKKRRDLKIGQILK